MSLKNAAFFLLLSCLLICALESEGPDYRLEFKGEKSFHLEKRMAQPKPIGFYTGMDRREALSLAMNGELFHRYKILGEVADNGPTDDQSILWFSVADSTRGLTLGRFRAAFPESRLFSISRRVEGGQAFAETRSFRADVVISRAKGIPRFDKINYQGAGAYYLTHAPLLAESERVELLSRILKRGRDYQIDYSSGRIVLTPRCVAEMGLQTRERFQFIRVSYESDALSREMEAGRVLWRPLTGLDVSINGVRESGIAHERADSLSKSIEPARYGGGMGIRVGQDSLCSAKGEAAFQCEKGRSTINAYFAEALIGGSRFHGVAGWSYKGEGYMYDGTEGGETGHQGYMQGSAKPLEALTCRADAALSRYPEEEGQSDELEGIGRIEYAPEKGQFYSGVVRKREVRQGESKIGNQFIEGETGRPIGPVRLSVGNGFESRYGRVSIGEVRERYPFFTKLATVKPGPFQCSINLSGEEVRLAVDSTGQLSETQQRAGVEGLVGYQGAWGNASASGMIRMGEADYEEKSLESRISGEHALLDWEMAYREGLEQVRVDTAQASEHEHKIQTGGNLVLKPSAWLRLKSVPSFHLRRNLTHGQDIIREIRHCEEAEGTFKRVKTGLQFEENRCHVRDNFDQQSVGRAYDADMTVMTLFSVQTRLLGEYRQEEERERHPETMNCRARWNKTKRGAMENTLLISEKHTLGFGVGYEAFQQTVDTSNGLALDSSIVACPTVEEEKDLFLFARRCQTTLFLEYRSLFQTFEAGLKTILLRIEDQDSTDGRSIGKRKTIGVQPEIGLSVGGNDTFSGLLLITGNWQVGYRQKNSARLELSLAQSIRLFHFSGRVLLCTEKVGEVSAKTAEFYLDVILRI
ncbi:MAG: hypothetical protein A2293_00080 [Elusimicrobia bacterium RIFOXYB2_FULL_49_7]|nr:MAG: hypothetical protein A2293_00080 [Elusimicrobia bacterium RIFOXYB2_FULL_49_7]